MTYCMFSTAFDLTLAEDNRATTDRQYRVDVTLLIEGPFSSELFTERVHVTTFLVLLMTIVFHFSTAPTTITKMILHF